MKLKKLLILATMMLVGCTKSTTEDGIIGDLTWSLSSGALTISGEGAMPDYPAPNQAPWDKFQPEIERILVSPGVTRIGDYAFTALHIAKNASLPASVTSIGKGAFDGCSHLASIDIPSGVNAIGERAFNDCEALTSIVLPEGLTTIEQGLFGGCSELADVFIPEGVTMIGWSVFQGCEALTNIALPEALTEIGGNAFNETALEQITLPAGLEEIGDSAFGDCAELKTVTIMATTPPALGIAAVPDGWTMPNSFNVADDMLYVPQGCVEAYRQAEGWGDVFDQIVEQE